MFGQLYYTVCIIGLCAYCLGTAAGTESLVYKTSFENSENLGKIGDTGRVNGTGHKTVLRLSGGVFYEHGVSLPKVTSLKNVFHHVNQLVPVQVQKPVASPVQVTRVKPHPVLVPKPIPVPVLKPIPYEVKVNVSVPYPVYNRVPFEVNVPVIKIRPVHVSIPHNVYVEKRVTYGLVKSSSSAVNVPPVDKNYTVRVSDKINSTVQPSLSLQVNQTYPGTVAPALSYTTKNTAISETEKVAVNYVPVENYREETAAGPNEEQGEYSSP